MGEEVEVEVIEKLIDRCNECKFATCENCEINWVEVQAIGKMLERYKYLEENRLWSEATIEGLRRDFINKDNIRQKIKFYKKVDNAVGVRILEKLLEEYK